MKILSWLFLLAVCTAQEPQPKVWVIIGDSAGGTHCDKSGCVGLDGYWTGIEKVYAKGFPSGWSPNWKDAKQYGIKDDPNYDIPNGRHCCYSEYPTLIDPQTGKEL